tara:strand:+ start:163 stop:654 length:492 start_codon:yes stop_codon:yes gene_type:complete
MSVATLQKSHVPSDHSSPNYDNLALHPRRKFAICRFCICESRHSPYATLQLGANGGRKPKDSVMADVVIVFWRDIPAQVIVGKGRRAAKVQLPERFEQAIDRCAMKIGARDSDAYLAEWRRAEPYAVDGDDADVARAEAARLEAEFDQDRIKVLIGNDGWNAA